MSKRTKYVWPKRKENPAERQREVRERHAPNGNHLKAARSCQMTEAIRDACGWAAETSPDEGTNLPTRPVRRVVRGLRGVGYLATTIFPGLGGLSFDALTCDPFQPVPSTRNPEEPYFSCPLEVGDFCGVKRSAQRLRLSSRSP